MTAATPASAAAPTPAVRGAGPVASIDRMLGRVTMYRLVTLSLIALSAIGIVFAGVGLAPVAINGTGAAVPAMLASLAVLVAWSVLSDLVIARLFRVSPQLESATITGLILFLILAPTLDPAALCGLAIAAILASASKYLIAPHGRHLLNPAAFGAFAAYSLGLGFTVWWAGLPPLLPMVAVLGLLVVARTRRVALVAVYLAAAAVVSLVLAGGASAFLAYIGAPLFLAFFMLTEPLTLPPRRWQQLIVALVVAVVPLVTRFALPVDLTGPALGPITPQLHLGAPEAALLIGNLVAAALARRRGIRLTLAGRRMLTPTSWELELAPSRPLRAAPGQWIELTLPHRADARGRRRTFSIASADGDRIRIGLRVPESRVSSFKTALLALEPGAALTATGVGGDFVPPAEPTTKVLLVAGGIGVTPFLAHLEHDRAARAERDTVLVYSASSAEEVAYADELARSGARVLLLSPSAPERMPEHWSWIGPGPLTAARLLEAVPDAAERTSYLSGPPALVAELRRGLRSAGVRRIRTDAFIGY